MSRRLTARSGIRRAWLTLSVGAAGMLVLTGCHTDMWIQPKYKPNQRSEFFPDERVNRQPPAGTVARGALAASDPLRTGRAGGRLVATIPASALVTFGTKKAMLLRGQERFDIFCSPCHGATGDGKGMIAQRGLKLRQNPATYHTDRLRRMPDGHFYDVITHGYGTMYSYASRIQDPADRWAIVAYIRALQLSQNASPAQLDAAERARIDASGGDEGRGLQDREPGNRADGELPAGTPATVPAPGGAEGGR